MSLQSFGDVEHSLRKRATEKFLAIMGEIFLWDELADFIKPHYFSGKRGRPPKGIEEILRMHPLQCRFKLSDESVECAIYDSFAFRKLYGHQISG